MEIKRDLNLPEIIEGKTDYKSTPCIYFLISDNEIVYVGQTQFLSGRLSRHGKDKTFDSYYVYECKAEEMNDLECHFIIKFNPIYNKTLPRESKDYITLNMLKNKFGIGKVQAKKTIREKDAEPVFRDYYHVNVFNVNMG